MYLLQLVQALKFESTASDQRSSRSVTSAISYDDSGLADFLIERSVLNPVLGNRFHWYLMVEVQDKMMNKMYGRVDFRFMTRLVEVNFVTKAIARPVSDFIERSKAAWRDENFCADKASCFKRFQLGRRNYAPPKIHALRRSTS